MTDQERITDFLCSEKKMTANYDSFASECVNIPLRDEFLRLFNQSHHSQTELFQTAQASSNGPRPGRHPSWGAVRACRCFGTFFARSG